MHGRLHRALACAAPIRWYNQGSELAGDKLYVSAAKGRRESTQSSSGGDAAVVSESQPKRTINTLAQKHANAEAITCVTAYDYPSGVQVHRAGIDACLVGDSAAMVVHGHGSTLPITLQQMVSHCAAVSRGCLSPLRIGDLPFGAYEQSSEQCVASASTLVKDGLVDAVKVEGASPRRLDAVEACVQSGIAVMGHVGLTPQSIGTFGGFKPQGKSINSATSIVEGAKALERAGAFSIVLECVPEQVAAAAAAEVSIPTIGIGAGRFVSGQVLVYHDLLGMSTHPHHNAVAPRFCKQYASVGDAIHTGLRAFASDVENARFPLREHAPYTLKKDGTFETADVNEQFAATLQQRGMFDAASAARSAKSIREQESREATNEQ